MATCRTCAYLRKCIEKATKEGYEHNVDFDPKDGCTGIGFKSNTNADRIRAMSDELLASQLVVVVKETIKALTDLDVPDEILNEVRSQLLERLKQPAEE